MLKSKIPALRRMLGVWCPEVARQVSDYEGGVWEWDDELLYWKLQGDEQYEVSVPTNGFIGTLDAATLSAGLAIFQYNDLCWRAHELGNNLLCKDAAAQQYKIRDHFLDNATKDQASKLLGFID